VRNRGAKAKKRHSRAEPETAEKRHGPSVGSERRRLFLRALGAIGCSALIFPTKEHSAWGGGLPCIRHSSIETVARSAVKLFLCGDVMTGRGIDQIQRYANTPELYEPYVRDALEYVRLAEQINGPIERPVLPEYIWGDALSELQRTAPEVRIINLETSITTHERPWPKGIHYRMHPRNTECLRAAKIDCCVLSNNHVLDWDRRGLDETLRSLDEAGIRHAGAGRDLAEAEAPAIIPISNGGRILVFGFGTTDSGIDPRWAATDRRSGVRLLPDLSVGTQRLVSQRVSRFKRSGDIAIASIHWGGNWGYAVPIAHRRLAQGLIDDGEVDLIHGHSSHHAKGIEIYRHHLILYGCGDFLNDYEGIRGHEEFRSDLRLMYFPLLERGSGRLLGMDLTATRARKLRLGLAAQTEARWLADVLSRESSGRGARLSSINGSRLALESSGQSGSARLEATRRPDAALP